MNIFIITGETCSRDPYDQDYEKWIDSVWYNKIEAEQRIESLNKAHRSHDEKLLKEVDYNSWERNRYFESYREYPDFEIEEITIQGTPNG